MLVCKKDFLQYKVGDKLPPKLDPKVAKILLRDGFAEVGTRSNAKVADYIKRTKDNPKKKNYYRKTHKKKDK